jgi:hypothetical protein
MLGLSVAVQLLTCPVFFGSEPVPPPQDIQLHPDSRVRITGHATLGRWECESREIFAALAAGPELAALVEKISGRGFEAKNQPVPHALLTIRVASLQCDKPGMRDDVLRALRDEEAPLIVFRLTGISTILAQLADHADLGRHQVETRGDLVLAGKLRPVDLTAVVVQKSARRFHIDAVKELRMSDFDIAPPRAALGLIRTDDNVTVSFSLILELVSPPATGVARTP